MRKDVVKVKKPIGDGPLVERWLPTDADGVVLFGFGLPVARRLSAEGQRVVTDFLKKYNPPVKLYAANHRHQYDALRSSGTSNDEINAMCLSGVMSAAWKFDPAKGFKFSTYALYWMWAECSRELYKHNKRYSESRLTLSLSGFESQCDNTADMDLADRRANEAEAVDEYDAVQQEVELALSALTPREQAIVKSRYGIGGSRANTLQETAAVCGMVTKERVRQLQAAAMEKMRRKLATA
jgi:RNA polymerase sigma factor (sigma-70 family)